MIDSKGIYRKADALIDKYGTRDPLVLAPQLGIQVNYVGDFHNLLGMYVYRWRQRAIFLNDRMDEHLTKMVCGHEIGHDIYHRSLAGAEGLKEFELFRMHDPNTPSKVAMPLLSVMAYSSTAMPEREVPYRWKVTPSL